LGIDDLDRRTAKLVDVELRAATPHPDRYIHHRLAEIALAVALVIIVKLVRMGGPLEPDNLAPNSVQS